VGPQSGLDSDRSDYVARLSLNTGLGPRVTARGRFDDASFDINRAEIEATTAFGPVTASTSYIYLRDNPNSGVVTAASVIRGAASVNLVENWRMFGTVTYDMAASAVAGNSFGIAYDDECLTFSLAYSATRPNYTDLEPTQWVNLRIQLRTFGEAGISTDLNKLQQ
jgi:LPS-assembly protein